MGYLYLKNEFPRLVELVELGLKRAGKWEMGHSQCSPKESGEAGRSQNKPEESDETGCSQSKPEESVESVGLSRRGEVSCDTRN